MTKYSKIWAAVFVSSASVFSTVFLYTHNFGTLPFLESLPFMLAFLSMGVLIMIALTVISKSIEKSALASAWIMIVLLNTGYLVEIMRYRYALLCVLIASILILHIVHKKLTEENAKSLVCVFGLVAACLLAFNVVSPVLSSISLQKSKASSDLSSTNTLDYINSKTISKEELPNIYFMIFDEYAGFNELKSVYQYDNTAFKDQLEALGFTVSSKSTNYKTNTFQCLADLFNLEIKKSNSEYDELDSRRQAYNGALFHILQSLGYSLYKTEVENIVPFENLVNYNRENKLWTTTDTGETTFYLIIKRSILFYPKFVDYLHFLITGTSYYEYQSWVYAAPATIMVHYSGDEFTIQKNAFTLAYICCPHGPFVFDSDGNFHYDLINAWNWKDPHYYLEQLEYVSKLILNAVNSILKKDPYSIIIIMSDHGVRNHGKFGLSDVTIEEATDILNAVYWKGHPIDEIHGQSGVNTLRIILNKTFELSLPMLE